ncbi:MAG: SAM-dependent MidA family methyltransferase [Lentimonas sp.]|jgi:SAM-dependent MidA family methyltransferase
MKSHLKNLITIGGALSISNFMDEALFHPKLGYYKKQNPFGKAGDFTTSPEISQVFGELIGAYLIGIWQGSYSDKKINLVEMGAGKGTLMKDLLTFAKEIPEFFKNFNISIIEISPKLCKIQQDNLKNFNISWYENFADFHIENSQNPIFFVSNELFDCFAIDQLIKTENGWAEKMVGVKNDDLEFTLLESIKKPNLDKDWQVGDVFEYSPSGNLFMSDLSQAIKSSGGIAIIVDYGYLESTKNTLQALKNHQYVEPLQEVGNCDITALVNFSVLKNIAVKLDLSTSIISQREFLINLGVEVRREKLLLRKTPSQVKRINSEIDRLIDEEQMGELFKILIIW